MDAAPIAELNQRRRELQRSIREERERQRRILDAANKSVQGLAEDHAEIFFSDQELPGKPFAERMEASLAEMRAEIARLEDGLGVHSLELDGELNTHFKELRDLEQRFDDLEHEIFHVDVRESAAFKELLLRLSKSESRNETVDTSTLEELIKAKETTEQRLVAIIEQRENQLISSIKRYQDAYSTSNTELRMEPAALAISRDLQTQSDEAFQEVETAREKLFKAFFQEELNQHKLMIGKYNNIRTQLEGSKKTSSQSQSPRNVRGAAFSSKSFMDDLMGASAHGSGSSNTTETAAKRQQSWKFEVLDRLEGLTAEELSFRHSQEDRSIEWLQSIHERADGGEMFEESNGKEKSSPPENATLENNLFIEQMGNRLQLLYEKHDAFAQKRHRPVPRTTPLPTPERRPAPARPATPTSASLQRFFGL